MPRTSVLARCVEGNAELVVKCLQSGMASNALVDHLVKDFMSISGHFRSSNIIHVRRQGNNVAHALARDARFSFPFKGLDGGSSSKYLLLRCKRFALVF